MPSPTSSEPFYQVPRLADTTINFIRTNSLGLQVVKHDRHGRDDAVHLEMSSEYNLKLVELNRLGPDDVGGGINYFGIQIGSRWVHQEISPEFGLKVVELDRIGPDYMGGGINQFKPWVQSEISS